MPKIPERIQLTIMAAYNEPILLKMIFKFDEI